MPYVIVFLLALLAGKVYWFYSDNENSKVLTSQIQQCEQKNTQECVKLALIYKDANSEEHDPSKMLYYFNKACELGDARSCTHLGKYYELGKYTKKELNIAIRYYEKGCKGNDYLACTTLAVKHTKGGQSAYARAVPLFLKACQGKVGLACYNLALLNMKGLEKDVLKAHDFFRRGCEFKHSKSCVLAAKLYATGENGVYKNPQKALYFFSRACAQNDVSACSTAGLYLLKGKAVKADYAQAFSFFQKADNKAYLAYMYEHGLHVEKNKQKALELYSVSSESWAKKRYTTLASKP